jgi:hypothetical protein
MLAMAIILNIAVDIFTGVALTNTLGAFGAVLASLASAVLGIALAL